MKFYNYLNEDMTISGALRKLFDEVKDELKNMSFSELLKRSEKAWKTISRQLSPEEKEKILKIAGFKQTDIEEELNLQVESVEYLQEDLKHWWDLVKQEAFPTLAFYPALRVWGDLDKMLGGGTVDLRVTLFYASLWLILISGKYLSSWMDWKRSLRVKKDVVYE